jgi:hypothetical protein
LTFFKFYNLQKIYIYILFNEKINITGSIEKGGEKEKKEGKQRETEKEREKEVRQINIQYNYLKKLFYLSIDICFSPLVMAHGV